MWRDFFGTTNIFSSPLEMSDEPSSTVYLFTCKNVRNTFKTYFLHVALKLNSEDITPEELVALRHETDSKMKQIEDETLRPGPVKEFLQDPNE